MARFDVCRNAGARAADVPFLLIVQADVLSDLGTRVVVPLRRRDRLPAPPVPAELMPVVVIDGIECVLEATALAAVPARLCRTPVTNLGSKQLEIERALDFLLRGF